MKRNISTVLLVLFAVGWALAQPPDPIGEEPPVRLKKKKKEKADPPPQNPDKPEPKPAPMPPRKPKLDEDIDLDPRDDVKLPDRKEADEDAIVRRLAKNTRLSEEKLGKRELGEPTRQVQKDIVEDLERLIHKQKQQSKQDQQQQQSSSSQDSDPMAGQSKEDPSRNRQARQRERQNRKGNQNARRNPGDQQGEHNGQGTPENPRGGGDSKAQGGPKDPEKKFDLWGHLPEKERALMNKEMEQRFMEKYDELTKQYYRTIAEKSQKKD